MTHLLLLLLLSIFKIEAAVPGSANTNEIDQMQKSKQEITLSGTLYPRATETRDVISLDGIWNFRASPADPDVGYRFGWFSKDLSQTGEVIPMPVPSSYNDIGEDITLRDHVGLVWYDRRFYVPKTWETAGHRVWLRFGSVHYSAQVWVNGKLAGFHQIGHLPFELEITNEVHYNASNLLTVVVDNTLLGDTVPQGVIYKAPMANKKMKFEQSYAFDFFNYAGIHRSVFLFSTPKIHIDDVIVNTDIQGLTGIVAYNITHKRSEYDEQPECLIQLFDMNDTQVAGAQQCAGLIEVPNANLWWPYLMDPHPGYLYTIKVSLVDSKGNTIDTYNEKLGIRTVTWTNSSVFINNKPIYFHGFGMHEDSDFRGKGWDPVLWVKNFNLLKWVGANSFRTSHYPYAEEIYQMADEQGIMIIDECPSVDTEIYSEALLKNHKQSLTELIRRDKNHPSVIMWSIANEPRVQDKRSNKYFEAVANHVRSMDLSRPITLAVAVPYNDEQACQHLDVISFNRYNGWYSNPGKIHTITKNVFDEAVHWRNKHNKPVLMSEYGADTMEGLHIYPEFIWSEEYQVAVLAEHFKAFDLLRKTGFFIGEFIWNFADFKTPQSFPKVGGNKKGIFTRNRQPKASALLVRLRYTQLGYLDYGIVPPVNITHYTSDKKPFIHEEL